jgi:hypothetical protein
VSRRPPYRACLDCGRGFYAWSGVRCPACTREIEPPAESLRDFRRRVIDPDRNPPTPLGPVRVDDAMLDPSWSPAAGYSHAARLLARLERREAPQ